MSALAARVTALRTTLRDPLIRNSVLMLSTTLAMAGVGAVFWVVAARVTSRAEVGYASSLVATTEALAIFAQLGLNVSLLRILPRSSSRASDVVVTTSAVALVAGVLAVAYGSLLPAISPDLARVVSWPLAVPLFAVLVAGTALNQLTDAIFLGIDRVRTNAIVNGVLLSVGRLVVAFLLGGAAALAVFGAVAGSAALAGVLSLVLILRALPDRPRLRPSDELRGSVRLSGAGYLQTVLYVVPQLVFPVLIVNAEGPAQSAVFFLSFQIVTLLNHAVYMVSNSMYAEVARHPHRLEQIVTRAGRTIGVAAVGGIVVLVAAAPLVLRIFGGAYSDAGTETLRVLALGTLGVGLNYWTSVRLRISQHLTALVGVQAFSTTVVVVLAAAAAPHGIVWVAAAWGVGQLAGGVVGYVLSRTVAPMRDGVTETARDEATAVSVAAGVGTAFEENVL